MTFVLPTYNREPWLAATLDSILDQSVKDIEVIVLDDGSTDYTHELMGEYANLDKRVKYVRFMDRQGAARCRNHGNRKALSPLIHCADAGDMYHKIAARVAIQFFKRYGDIEVFYSSVGVISDRGTYLAHHPAKLYASGTKINFSHPSVVYKQGLVSDRYRYREVSVHTDAYEALFLQMAKEGVKFGFTDKTLVMKREIEDDASRDLIEAHKIKKGIYDEFGLKWPFPEVV